MMNIGILIIVIAVIVLAIFASRKNQMEGAEQNRETEQTEKETFANEDILSYGQVQERKRELIDAIETNLADKPEQLAQLKQIINDWAELKVKSFLDRRSWVRKPEEEE
jgi:flagellar biosynthesis/type III secretory pathway M-ring protein FliF/YscJ